MDELDRLLAMSDPLGGTEVAPLETAALHALTEMTMQEAPATPTRRHRRVLMFLAAAVAVVGIPTAAVAANGGIHTGFFGGPNDTEDIPGEEFLNLSDPAIVAVVREEVAKTPLPPGDSLDFVVKRYPIVEPTNGQRLVIVQEVQYNAACRC